MRKDYRYKLTTDWATPHYSNWDRWFGHLTGVSNVRMLEIGTHQGRSAMWFADNVLTGEGSEIFCIDTWADESAFQDFLSNMRRYPFRSRIFAVRDNSDWLSRVSPGKFNAAYIDGDHSYEAVKRDIDNVAPLIVPGGLLLFDDYEGFDGVHAAVNQFIGENEGWETLDVGWQYLVRKI